VLVRFGFDLELVLRGVVDVERARKVENNED